MKLFAAIRRDEAVLVEAMAREHDIVMPEHYRELFLDIKMERLPWPDDPMGEPGWFNESLATKLSVWAAKAPQVIDAVRKAAPDAMIVWSDAPPMLRIAVLAAKNLGIPTFEITHGCMNSYRQAHFEADSAVDCILAPGQEEVDFRKFYGSESEVLITGKPSFDWLAAADIPALKEEIRESLNIPPKRPVVMYAMTWRHPFSVWERDRNMGVADVFSAHMTLQSICRPFLIIKPHYSASGPQALAHLKKRCVDMGIAEYGIYTGPPANVLPAVDLLVSHKSSILAEAVLMDIPAVGFDFREMNDFVKYENLGIKWVSERIDLLPAMTAALLDRRTKDSLASDRKAGKRYFNGPNDGLATKRCLTAVAYAKPRQRATA